jgi:hypothetical protein
MALVRCDEHGAPRGRTQTYVQAVHPLGYPITAAICGRENCSNPGLLWLNEDDKKAYDNVERIFPVQTAAAKVKAA